MPDFRAVILIWALAALVAGPWLAGPLVVVNADRCVEMMSARTGCGTACGGDVNSHHRVDNPVPSNTPDDMPCKTRCPMLCASCVAPAATLPGSIAARASTKFSLRGFANESARSRVLAPEPHPPRGVILI